MRAFLIVWVLAQGALGQDWGGLHLVNADLAFGKRWNLQLHTRMRSNSDFRQIFQRRGGPIVSYQWRPKLTLIGGYYLINEDDSLRRGRDFHRMFGGFSTPVLERPGFRLEARTLAERFAGTAQGDFWRVRQRLTAVVGRRTWRPYWQAEGLHLPGAWVGRFGAGAQYVPRRGWSGMIGYEFRQSPNGHAMHLISSTIQVQLRKRKE